MIKAFIILLFSHFTNFEFLILILMYDLKNFNILMYSIFALMMLMTIIILSFHSYV